MHISAVPLKLKRSWRRVSALLSLFDKEARNKAKYLRSHGGVRTSSWEVQDYKSSRIDAVGYKKPFPHRFVPTDVNIPLARQPILNVRRTTKNMAQPSLDIPSSMSTVVVHIIDSTSRLQGIPTAIFMEPSIKGFEELRCPAYSFLIEHPDDGRKLLFDLGVRKDWENLAPTIQKNISHWNAKVIVEKGVAEILEEGGVGPQEVEAIIWRSVVHSWQVSM